MPRLDPAPPRWLTTAQAAEIAEVSMWTVQWWIREGQLPAWRVGRSYRIDPADLDALMGIEPGSSPMTEDPLAEQIRRVLAGDGEFPEPTDDQIRLIARLLPRRGQETA